MSEADVFSKALENPNAAPEVRLPQDVIDTSDISSEEEAAGDGSGEDSDHSNPSTSSSEDESDADGEEPIKPGEDAAEEDEDLGDSGAIRSKHELPEEPIPDLPEDYQVPEDATISPIGNIKTAFENNIIIQATVSGEKRVLKEGSVLCLEDRGLIGVLCEVFGKLQNPFYRVTLPTSKNDRFEELKQEVGSAAYVLVPEAHWVDTFELKKFKGTDASNGYDEELPEEEQEFSDDEKEALSKKIKKEKNKRRKEGSGNTSRSLKTHEDHAGAKKPKCLVNSTTQKLPSMKVPQSMGSVGYRSRTSRQGELRSSNQPRQKSLPSPQSSYAVQAPQQPAYQPADAYYAQRPVQSQVPAFPPSVAPPFYQQQQQPPYNYGMPYAQQSPQPQFQPHPQFMSPPLQPAQPFYQGQAFTPSQAEPQLVQQAYQQFPPPAAGPAPPIQQNMQQVLQLHQLLMQQQQQQQQQQQPPQQPPPQQQQQQPHKFNYNNY